MEGDLGWSHVLAVVDSTIYNNCGKGYSLHTYFSLHTDPGVGFLDHLVVLFQFKIFSLYLSFHLFILSLLPPLPLCAWVYSCVSVYMCAMAYMWRSEDFLGNTALYHMCSWGSPQVISLDCKHFNPLSHLFITFLFFLWKLCLWVCSGAHRNQERMLDPLELELSVVVRCLTWVLRTKLMPSARAALHSSSLAPICSFLRASPYCFPWCLF